MAYAATGEFEKADTSLKEFLTSIDSNLAEMTGTNQAFNIGVLTFYKTLYAIDIRATIARNKGDYKSAIKFLREAAATEDSIFYSDRQYGNFLSENHSVQFWF